MLGTSETCLYYGKHGDLSQLPGDPCGHVSTSKGVKQWGRKIIAACFGTGKRWENLPQAGKLCVECAMALHVSVVHFQVVEC